MGLLLIFSNFSPWNQLLFLFIINLIPNTQGEYIIVINSDIIHLQEIKYRNVDNTDL
jgi:hypothetical protein